MAFLGETAVLGSRGGGGWRGRAGDSWAVWTWPPDKGRSGCCHPSSDSQGGCEGRLYPCCSVAQDGCRESLRRKGALWRKPLSSFWAVTGGHMLATGLLEGRRAHRQEEIRRTPSPEQVLVEPCSSFHLLPIKCWGAQQKWLHCECRGRRMVHQLCQMKPPSTKAAHLQPRP